jgi:hypothetical protein
MGDALSFAQPIGFGMGYLQKRSGACHRERQFTEQRHLRLAHLLVCGPKYFAQFFS